MALCPQCGQDVHEDFGMVQCPNCQAIFRIELDGRILQSDSSEEDLGSDEVIPVAEEEVPEFESVIPDAHLNELEAPAVKEFEAAPFEFSDIGEDSAEDSVIQNETSNPLSVTAYAESSVSEAPEGPYLYRLQIEGLDTQEMLQDFRRVLEEDPKLGLEASLILSRIAQGQLRIDGLNPAKAAILVRKLRAMPVKVSWEQYAYYEADPK